MTLTHSKTLSNFAEKAVIHREPVAGPPVSRVCSYPAMQRANVWKETNYSFMTDDHLAE